MQHTLVNHRIMIGKKKPKRPETIGGSTPDTKSKLSFDACFHSLKNGT